MTSCGRWSSRCCPRLSVGRGRSPVDRGRTGSKHHLITDATGIPLAATLTGGNRNDVTQLIPLLQAMPPVRGKRGRPRRRPDVVLGDRGYDHDKYRRLVWDLGVKPLIARRGTEHGSGLGTQRWVVERRVRPPALVPPPADPLGDTRRHPRSIPHPRMRTHPLAATARSAERVRELVGRRESSSMSHWKIHVQRRSARSWVRKGGAPAGASLLDASALAVGTLGVGVLHGMAD